VKAGDDQTITLPANGVDLSGGGTDAENNTLTYAWTATPATGVTFTDATAAVTHVTFTDAGTYTLTLTANDGTTTGTDDVAVTVNAAAEPPPPPPPPVADLVWPGVDPNNPVTDPNYGWTAAAAVDVGMDQAALDSAITYAKSGGGAGMITRHGKLIAQWSDPLDPVDLLDDITIDKKMDIKSSTKSIGSIALGIAMDKQLIALTDTAQSKYPGFGSTTPAPADATWLSQITVQQLGTHTSGFIKSSAPTVALQTAPGSNWVYSDGGLNWLSDTLTNVLQQDIYQLLKTSVWAPLNITTDDLTWRIPSGGNVRPPIGAIQTREFSAGISANANAMARIGLLFLRKGMWKDQRILSESFVTTVSTPRPETKNATLSDPAGYPSANEGYGLMWWTNATGIQLPSVPKDAYWAWGLGDSLIVVIPSLDVVIARVGQDPDHSVKQWRPGWNGDYKYLDPFLTPISQSVTSPEK